MPYDIYPGIELLVIKKEYFQLNLIIPDCFQSCGSNFHSLQGVHENLSVCCCSLIHLSQLLMRLCTFSFGYLAIHVGEASVQVFYCLSFRVCFLTDLQYCGSNLYCKYLLPLCGLSLLPPFMLSCTSLVLLFGQPPTFPMRALIPR